MGDCSAPMICRRASGAARSVAPARLPLGVCVNGRGSMSRLFVSVVAAWLRRRPSLRPCSLCLVFRVFRVFSISHPHRKVRVFFVSVAKVPFFSFFACMFVCVVVWCEAGDRCVGSCLNSWKVEVLRPCPSRQTLGDCTSRVCPWEINPTQKLKN